MRRVRLGSGLYYKALWPKQQNAAPKGTLTRQVFKAVTSLSRSAVPFLGLRVHQFYLEGRLAFVLVVVPLTDDHSELSMLGQCPLE
jgi:hypothetical protein